MKLPTEKYTDQLKRLPTSGQHIIGCQTAESIVVYQAYKPSIARYSVKYQQLGGNGFKYERMSWIKPNFLWMMFRAGWATKENQEHILAIEISKQNFTEILSHAVHSSFKSAIYGTEPNWKEALKNSGVRLQWDPDHDPHGNKIERRAIQLGLQGDIFKAFATDWIIGIEDITPFVAEQREKTGSPDLLVPYEEVFSVDELMAQKLGMKAN